jgi:hypothetical protein
MLDVLHVLTVLLVAVAFALALAHVAELPGKKRLPRDTYLRVQRIYYPGFTVGGGIGEFGGLLAAIVLAIVTPRGTAAFWLTLVAVLGLVGMQVVFWTVTQPVNRFWLHGENLGNFSSGFFGVHRVDQGTHGQPSTVDWTKLRDRWEYSHVVRAAFATISLIALVMACKTL